MKKQISLLCTLVVASAAHAQSSFGGKAGFNYHIQGYSLGESAPTGATAPNNIDGFGFHVGAFAQCDLSDKLFLRQELLYRTRNTQRMTQSSNTILDVTTVIDTEEKGNMSLLEFPILLGYRLSDRLSLHVGPGMGILLGNKVTVSGTSSVTTGGQTVTTTLDATDRSREGLRSVEFAGLLGLGYRTEGGLDLGVRYWRGLTTINEDTDLFAAHQNVIQFSVGYAFRCK